MNRITKLDQISEQLITKNTKKRVAVAWAQDQNTIGALARLVDEGFVEAIMVGDKSQIENSNCKTD